MIEDSGLFLANQINSITADVMLLNLLVIKYEAFSIHHPSQFDNKTEYIVASANVNVSFRLLPRK